MPDKSDKPDKPPKIKRYYWDTSTFIKLISNMKTQEAVEAREHCKRFFRDTMVGKVQLFTSTVTIVEVLRAEEDDKFKMPDDMKQKIRDLFEEPYIALVPLDPARAIEARELRWQYPWLKTADAIQIVSAVYATVDEMHTYDGITKPKGILSLNNLVGNPPLKIVVPKYEGIGDKLL